MMRDRLVKLIEDFCRDAHVEKYIPIQEAYDFFIAATAFADYLLANGVVVTPCVAMVEQFIKNGKFDRKITAHNGKTAVIYVDKSKWSKPLIDITEQHYSTDKAEERIAALKGGAE